MLEVFLGINKGLRSRVTSMALVRFVLYDRNRVILVDPIGFVFEM